VEDVRAEYERLKAELSANQTRFFKEELAKLKAQAQLLEQQRAISSLKNRF
jgi:vacuolar-type H+-ATPase subunit E/Vma4